MHQAKTSICIHEEVLALQIQEGIVEIKKSFGITLQAQISLDKRKTLVY